MGLRNTITAALMAAVPTVSAATPESAPPPVRVEFVHPEKFTDVGDSHPGSDRVRAAYLDLLGKHIVSRAAAHLPAGQVLTVSITDVDMAGHFEPWRSRLGDTRIVRDIYPPRIDLHFTLSDNSNTAVKNGQRKLRDLAFLMTTVSYRDDPLRYEKALIDQWLERDFPHPLSSALDGRSHSE